MTSALSAGHVTALSPSPTHGSRTHVQLSRISHSHCHLSCLTKTYEKKFHFPSSTLDSPHLSFSKSEIHCNVRLQCPHCPFVLQMHRVIWHLFRLIPSPETGATTPAGEIEAVIRSLGFGFKRALMIKRFLGEWVADLWMEVGDLHGIGK